MAFRGLASVTNQKGQETKIKSYTPTSFWSVSGSIFCGHGRNLCHLSPPWSLTKRKTIRNRVVLPCIGTVKTTSDPAYGPSSSLLASCCVCVCMCNVCMYVTTKEVDNFEIIATVYWATILKRIILGSVHFRISSLDGDSEFVIKRIYDELVKTKLYL